MAPDSGFGPAFDALSPVRVSKVKESPVDAELERMGVGLAPAAKVTQFEGVPVDLHNYADVWQEYQRLAGNALKHPVWGTGAKDLLDKVVSGDHERAQLYPELPSLGAAKCLL